MQGKESVSESFSMGSSYEPLHESETLSFWKKDTRDAKKKRMDFMSTQIKALVALKMQKQDNIPAEVHPGLFLGSIGSALHKANLQENGITHILTAVGKIKPAHPEDFTYKTVPLMDSPDQDIQKYFEETNEFIEEALKENGKVLVHCFAGKSRSCTLVVAYLMWKLHLTLPQCMHQIHQKRPIARPNVGFLRQLRRYQAKFEEEGLIKRPIDSDEEQPGKPPKPASADEETQQESPKAKKQEP